MKQTTVHCQPAGARGAMACFTGVLVCAALTLSIAATDAFAASDNETRNPTIALDEDSALSEKLLGAYKALGPDYKPRTEHLFDDGTPHYINRLISEDSPYLVQHAHNPVNWYPWGEEPMQKAWNEDKPLFLSIGYATCHWCHVMERESFENEEIADFLNEHFVAVKVDREQRPDVDSTYMTAVQMMTGGGGWPLSSFLNVKATPFYGGTYYPPETFLNLLKQIVKVWNEDRDELENQAGKVGEALSEINTVKSAAKEIGENDIQTALDILLRDFDDFLGGFGGAPKFPREPALYLLLEQARRTGNNDLLTAAHFTLERIAAGGIHDQAAGGFHRYTVDESWLVPHFEKMLYNQAALTRNYLQSWLLTGDIEHQRIVRRTLDYVLREMTAPEGGFYSATDADSGGGEGRFFIWTIDELRTVLGDADAELATKIWNITDGGNFEHANILHLTGPIRHLAIELDMTAEALTAKIDSFSEKLLKARQAREHPQLDDKIISSWNGMMITALAEAGDVLKEPRYIEGAAAAARFVMQANVKSIATEKPGDLELWRTHYHGTSSVDAGQSDYAFLAEAMISLFDVTGETQWLDHAEQLVASMNKRFWDNEDGAYFMGSIVSGGAALPVRPKERYDNATPTGNSVALRVLARLAARTGDEAYQERAEKLLAAFSGLIDTNPSAFGYLLTGTSELQFGESGHRQFAARGNVSIEATMQEKSGEASLNLNVVVADGWHINAHKPLQDYLIGTSVQTPDGSNIEGLTYPKPKRAKLGFERSELALYENTIEIDVPVSKLPSANREKPFDPTSYESKPVIANHTVAVNIQACNDTVCLAPETITLNVSPYAAN